MNIEQQNQNQHQPTFNELLIAEVYNHPELYSQADRICTDSTKRNEIWIKIAKNIDPTLGITGDFAKKRWLQMRDRYRKELRNWANEYVKPKWPFFDMLRWLDKYLKDPNGILTIPMSRPPTPTSNYSNENFNLQLSTNALLENLTAASSSAFLQLQNDPSMLWEKASFTNELNEKDREANLSNSSNEKNDLDEPRPCSSLSNQDFNQEQKEIKKIMDEDLENLSQRSKSSDSSNISIVEGGELDTQKLFNNNNNATFDGNSAVDVLNSPEYCFLIQTAVKSHFANSGLKPMPPTPNTSSETNTRKKIRPYLVRRGGGVKIRGEIGGSPMAESLDKQSGIRKFKKLSTIKSLPHQIPLATTPTEQYQNDILSSMPKLIQLQNIKKDGSLVMNEEKSHGRRNLSSSSSTTDPTTNSTDLTQLNLHDSKTLLWMTDDEDLVFAKLIVIRLKKFSSKDRRSIRAKITDFIDKKEEEMEKNSGLD